MSYTHIYRSGRILLTLLINTIEFTHIVKHQTFQKIVGIVNVSVHKFQSLRPSFTECDVSLLVLVSPIHCTDSNTSFPLLSALRCQGVITGDGSKHDRGRTSFM